MDDAVDTRTTGIPGCDRVNIPASFPVTRNNASQSIPNHLKFFQEDYQVAFQAFFQATFQVGIKFIRGNRHLSLNLGLAISGQR
jgi:hypothetical protein